MGGFNVQGSPICENDFVIVLAPLEDAEDDDDFHGSWSCHGDHSPGCVEAQIKAQAATPGWRDA